MNKELLKIGVSLINSTSHVEESARVFLSSMRIKPHLIKFGGMSTPRYAEPVQLITGEITKALVHLKEANSIISQVMVKKEGNNKVIDMSYNLIDIVDKLYCLSLDDQEEIAELINLKFNKNQ